MRPVSLWAGWVAPIMFMIAGCLFAAAILLPLWGMTLVSVQYSEGLRLVVYPTHIAGDISELNLLNKYIGMPTLSDDFFVELKVLPVLFGVVAIACFAAAFVRRIWTGVFALVLISGAAAYGFWSMQRRLYQFGHDLDPTAPIDLQPFTPPMFGENQIAQFATYSYFTWGTLLPLIASGLIVAALCLQLRARRADELGA